MPGFGEILHGTGVAETAEPAQEVLGAVGENNQTEYDPGNESRPFVVCLHELLKHCGIVLNEFFRKVAGGRICRALI